MSAIGPKPVGWRLDPVVYEIRRQVLRRDRWRCQYCGAMSNLEVHHKRFRSHSGHDSEENLITLCSVCHSSLHGCILIPQARSSRLSRYTFPSSILVCEVRECRPQLLVDSVRTRDGPGAQGHKR